MSTLYLVATPIGNLGDMSPRAVEILKTVRLVAAEDTRHSGKLLKHFGVDTPLTSYYAHNEREKLEQVVAELASGDLALISDAGMPAISDPGYLLVRAALDAGHEVIPVPGPSAPIAALAASGLPTDSFLYLGYPPRKTAERRKAFEQVAAQPHTLVWLESPHRLQATLNDMQAVFGERQVAVAAEMTKLYERFFRGSLQAAITYFGEEPARGEFTIVLAGAPAYEGAWDAVRVQAALQKGMDGQMSPSQLARQVPADAGWKRSDVYDLLQELAEGQ